VVYSHDGLRRADYYWHIVRFRDPITNVVTTCRCAFYSTSDNPLRPPHNPRKSSRRSDDCCFPSSVQDRSGIPPMPNCSVDPSSIIGAIKKSAKFASLYSSQSRVLSSRNGSETLDYFMNPWIMNKDIPETRYVRWPGEIDFCRSSRCFCERFQPRLIKPAHQEGTWINQIQGII